MSIEAVGMAPQDRSERERFENEVQRIVEAGNQGGVTLRLLGSLAFQIHCPKYGFLQEKMGRAYTDIDFAGYSRETKQVRALMEQLGYSEQREVFVVSEGSRAIFENGASGMHVDVFYEKLDFCHPIPWDGRLEVDSPTIPLAEMVLEKMQIVKINEKDVIDTILLLLEHELGDDDQETINMSRIGQMCGDDWGLWRTVTMNLDKVKVLAQGYAALEAGDKARLAGQIDKALARIEAAPKTMGWRLRARVGDRVKWYKEVDEVD
ncbi:MAG: hypothetical protein MUO23_14775 [Anaerolineales bacterium]|nr:hypothetical protein [Anaerolineales bacterium]